MAQLTLKLADGSELGVYQLASPPCLRDRLIIDGRELAVAGLDYRGTPPAVAAVTLSVVETELRS